MSFDPYELMPVEGEEHVYRGPEGRFVGLWHPLEVVPAGRWPLST